MKRKRGWHKLGFIIPIMIILPPIGLLLLWLSPHKRVLKDTLTVILVALLIGGAYVAKITGLFTPEFREPPYPKSGYNIKKDDRGRYEIDRILRKERMIFNQVVDEMHRIQNKPVSFASQLESSAIEDPEANAIAIVGERNGMDSTDVRGIYLKVSSKLAPRRK